MPDPGEPDDDEPVTLNVTIEAELVDGDMVVMRVTREGEEAELFVLNLDEYNGDDAG